MERAFIGSEALAAGDSTQARAQRVDFRRLLPGRLRARGASSPRCASGSPRSVAVVAAAGRDRRAVGLGAARREVGRRRHAGRIDLGRTTGPPRGVVTRDDTPARRRDRPCAAVCRVTTAERTAFDLGRRGSIGDAVARLDALGTRNAVSSRRTSLDLAERHPQSGDCVSSTAALDLVDAGAESPRETWLRLLLIRAGFPRPQTQIPVLGPTAVRVYCLDMGWEDAHDRRRVRRRAPPRDRLRCRKDIIRSEYLAHVGWTHIRVVAGERDADVLRRVRAGMGIETALRSRISRDIAICSAIVRRRGA